MAPGLTEPQTVQPTRSVQRRWGGLGNLWPLLRKLALMALTLALGAFRSLPALAQTHAPHAPHAPHQAPVEAQGCCTVGSTMCDETSQADCVQQGGQWDQISSCDFASGVCSPPRRRIRPVHPAGPVHTHVRLPLATATASVPTPSPTATAEPNPCAGLPDGRTCPAGDGPTFICANQRCVQCLGTLPFLPDPLPPPRFVDNLDGTLTDRATCLVWEQKTGMVGGAAVSDDPHDVNNIYQWCNSIAFHRGGMVLERCRNGSNPPDGSAFTDFLARLNQARFGGYGKWRLPKIHELEGIVDANRPGCQNGTPCIVQDFTPTQADIYWSSKTTAVPEDAFYLNFFDGLRNSTTKPNRFFVRAVHGP
jgi:hypothetical protein